MVRPKKFLGQHFLRDRNIAQKIVDALHLDRPTRVLEIGPGTGVLTGLLLANPLVELVAIELDRESVAHLRMAYPTLELVEGDFLKVDLAPYVKGALSVIGNFPYNISSQIFFKVLDHHHQINQVVCMLQKEVADRIASPPGSKVYGILSVLLQTYYKVEMLFKVSPGVFQPPPKVISAVIRLTRNNRTSLPCDEQLFVQVVKQGFNNRRKTLRNALKNLNLPAAISALPLLDKRAEQLSVDDFLQLTLSIEQARGATEI